MRPRTARQAHGSVPSTPRRSRESAFVPREYQAARWHCERLAQMWAREPGAERKHAAAYTHSCQWPSHRQSHLMPAHMQAPSASGGPSRFLTGAKREGGGTLPGKPMGKPELVSGFCFFDPPRCQWGVVRMGNASSALDCCSKQDGLKTSINEPPVDYASDRSSQIFAA